LTTVLAAGEYGDTLGIVSLAFSSDGEILTALTDLPSYQLAIWDWKNESMLCRSEVAGNAASCVLINPLNDRQFCTFGCDSITFWDLAMTFKGLQLKQT
jgi:hypothetical protein